MQSMIAKLRTACGQNKAAKPHCGFTNEKGHRPATTDHNARIDALRQAGSDGNAEHLDDAGN